MVVQFCAFHIHRQTIAPFVNVLLARSVNFGTKYAALSCADETEIRWYNAAYTLIQIVYPRN